MKIESKNPWPLGAVSIATFVAMLTVAVPAGAQESATAPGTFLGAVLISDDADAASEFYASVFDWDMERADDGGYAVRHKGRMIAGISPLDASDDQVEESFWLVGIAVEDIDGALRTARKINARIYEDSQRVGEYGRFAVIADRQKAPVLLIEPGAEQLGRSSDHGSWVWAELWTNDVEDAAAFYADVVGVDHETTDRGGEDYHLFSSRQKPVAGIITIPAELETVEPGWAPYVAVSDLGTTLGKVKELGGKVIFDETEHPAAASVALIMDPSGAVLFLYQVGSSGETK
jgi:predicted enzyme related to lactoylglutathione lyase